MKLGVGLAVIVVLVLSSLALAGSYVRAQQGSASISLAVVPPQLPADGKAYEVIVVQILNAEGLPVIARAPVKISLTSSKVSVASVDYNATINAGEFYAKANFYTTRTPGSTEITALAEGFGAAQFKVSTVIAGGTPSELAVYPGPETLLPDRGVSSKVIVQLQDLRGLPARAPADVQVTLASSHSNIGSITPTATIPKGGTFVTSTFVATDAAGSTTITASASGYGAGSAIISSKGPTPARLAVFAAPTMIRGQSGEQASIAVQLRDLDGRPAKAPVDILVSLSSSNATVGAIDSTTVIPSGATFALVKFVGGGALGSSQVTASSPGLISGSTTVTASPRGGAPTTLRIYLAPDTLLPDNGLYTSIVVQLLDQFGLPSSPTIDEDVILSSSNTEVGRVPDSVKIPAGSNFAIAPFESTFLAGTTEITAHATNLVKNLATVSTSGPVPSRLAVYSVPKLLTADGATYKAVVIQLQDAMGSAAKAPSDISVSLSSSNTDIGAVDNTVIIPTGATYVLADFRSSATAGKTEITATATGYDPSSYVLSTTEPYPSKLTVYNSPSVLVANGKVYDSVLVQLQDSGGNPATLPSPVSIALSSSSSSMGKVGNEAEIAAGSTFTVVPVQVGTTAGDFDIFAFAPGFTTGSANVKTVTNHPTITVSPTGSLTAKVGQKLEFTVQALDNGSPIPGAKISASSTSGAPTPSSVLTDENGIAKLSFEAQTAGEVQLGIGASAPGYTPTVVTISITVEDAGILSIFAILGTFQGIPTLLIVMLAAGGAAAFLLLWRRRIRRRRAQEVSELGELEFPEPNQ